MPDWFPHSLTEAVVFAPLRIAFLVVVLVVLRVILHKLIDRVVRRAVQGNSRFRLAEKLGQSPLAAARRQQRLTALGSLAKSVLTVVLLVVGAAMVLAEMGFNVTTLIAGTSIIGVSLAFGLQNVIKDLVSGVFMLVEDQMGLGDVVELQQAGLSGGGVVEAIGLRVTQLRLEDGTVSYVRNGEVTRVLNYSQGGPGQLPAAADETPADEPSEVDPKVSPDEPADRR